MKKLIIPVLLFLFVFCSINSNAANKQHIVKKLIKVESVTFEEIGCQFVGFNTWCGAEYCLTICVPAGTTWSQFSNFIIAANAYLNNECYNLIIQP